MKIFKFIGKLIGIVLALFVVFVIVAVATDDDSKSNTTTKTAKTKKVEGPVYTRENPNPITDFEYEFTDDKKAVQIISYKGTSSSVIVPETIEGYSVREIYGWKLNSDKNPYNIYIPRSVKILYGDCFYGINGNIDIDLENTQLEGTRCFSNSGISGTLVISPIMFTNNIFRRDRHVEHLYFTGNRFSYTKIEKLIVKEGVKEICEGDFKGCENLISITLPESLTYIGESAFANCPLLTEVNVPKGKKINIRNYAFSGDTALSLTMRKKLIDYGYDGDFIR